MGKIVWAPSALKDIESIARFIERDSIDQSSLSAFAEYHGFLSRACLSADRDECGKKPWRYGGFRRSNISADNPQRFDSRSESAGGKSGYHGL